MSVKTKENIKMIIIVVLFLTTILLLYLIWGGSDEVKVSDLIPRFGRDADEIEVGSSVEPDKTYYSAGDGSFRCVSDSYYTFRQIMEKFRNFSDKSTVMSMEIQKEQFEEAIKNHPSVIAEFTYTFPFAELCSDLGIGGSNAYSNIGNINSVCFSSAATDSLLVANTAEKKYYRLVSDSVDLEFEEPFSFAQDYNCYEVSRVLGVGEGGLFPLLSQTYLQEGSCSESNNISAEEYTEIARIFFGDSFDFVRRISDSFGNHTFMYGFGQKTLTLGADGSIEYKAEAETGNSGGFYGDLKTAKSFINAVIMRHYAYPEDVNGGLKLKSVTQTGSGKSAAYTFRFVQYCECELYDPEGNGYALEITVENGQVSRLKSKIVLMDTLPYDETLPHQVVDAANVIAANAPSDEAFVRIAENYRSMDEVLYISEGKLLPAWKLTLDDGSILFYDLFTGESMK